MTGVPASRPWALEREPASAAAFHAREVPEGPERMAWVCDLTGPAVILGSTQRDDLVDRAACARAGVDLVRRRSGGGAVLAVPGDLLWVDLLVPRDDPLWRDDVGLAFSWVGEAWAAALAELGVVAEVHRGTLVRTPWSEVVCYAGLGPGEVTAGGRKVVGIAQRRTRWGARFQCAALERWDPDTLRSLLALDDTGLDPAELARAATGVGVPLEDLLTSLLRHLP